MELTTTTWPRRATIEGRVARIVRHCPSRLICTVRSNASGSIVSTVSDGGATPALATRTSMPPNAESTLADASSKAPGSRTSAATASARDPSESATVVAAARSMSSSATAAPAR